MTKALFLILASLAIGQTPPTFRGGTDLVLVPIVVRDRHGDAVGNLTQRDFRLYDNGKPQIITTFSALQHATPTPASNGAAGSTTAGAQTVIAHPDGSRSQRNFVYIFDDLNIRFADLARLRTAAADFFTKHFSAGDRAAVYTLTGKHSLDFTTDRDKLETAVSQLRWGTVAAHGGMTCPDVSYYIADLVIDKADDLVLQALTDYTAQCAHVRPELARHLALSAAYQQTMLGREDTRRTLATLQLAVRQLSQLPGERVIVFSSPGFFAQTPQGIRGVARLLQLAAQNHVIIDGLSVRGVIVAEEEEDVARQVIIHRQGPPKASSPDQAWIRYRRESAEANGDVMRDLAAGTGGTFFRHNNDLRLGFQRLAAIPEFSYVLGFSPASLKLNGSFHKLKVVLPELKHVSVEARGGYYAVALSDHSDLAETVLASELRNDIPVVLQTGYSRPAQSSVVTVQIVARIGTEPLHFDETVSGSEDTVDVVVALFDKDGTCVTDRAESEHLRRNSGTVAGKDNAVTLRWDLPSIQNGEYVVRFVVHEPKSGATTVINRTLTVL
ncbi:MAG: VWA domain-containing protein [Acidobacteria bacterium]|nr:VWA domain-containing protein [Acidobacteriota bacterium]